MLVLVLVLVLVLALWVLWVLWVLWMEVGVWVWGDHLGRERPMRRLGLVIDVVPSAHRVTLLAPSAWQRRLRGRWLHCLWPSCSGWWPAPVPAHGVVPSGAGLD